MKPYSFMNAYGELLTIEVPDGLNVIVYHLHSIGKGMKKALPVISIALVMQSDGTITGRGICICSPSDHRYFNKKEGRLRAVARALRAHKRSTNGIFFRHPNARKVLKDVFDSGLYDEFNWTTGMDRPERHTLKFEYVPVITTGEQELIESKGF